MFDVAKRRRGARRHRRHRARSRPLDILVNNAGIQRRNPLVDFKQQDWDDVIATNLTAPFLVAQAVLPGMIARKSGKIINIASLMSELARPTVVPYTAAKGGVRQLTRGMAVELAPHNIQVNAISPGYFATEMNRALIDNVEFNAWVCKRTPAGRWGEPPEIAGLAVFLSSAAANYITGQLITIDGGMSVALVSVRGRAAQCRVPPLPGFFALADTASTDSVNVRCSFGFIAPTPISLRAISTPRSLRIDTTTVYSQGSPSGGCRMLPSMHSGVSAGGRCGHIGAHPIAQVVPAGRAHDCTLEDGLPTVRTMARRPGLARAHGAHEPAPLSAPRPMCLPTFGPLPSSQPNSA